MNQGNLIQSLESRLLLSAKLIDEPVSEYAGTSQTERIAYLPTLHVSHLSQLSAEINWGDSSTSLASFVRDKNGGIDIMGTHEYIDPGTFSVSALVEKGPYTRPGQATPQYILDLGTVNTNATVSTAPPKLIETAGQKFTAVIAGFHQPTVDVIFTAKINWGDGTTTKGTITGDGPANGDWQVTATHTYKKTGLYVVHTYIYSHVVGFKIPKTASQDLITLIQVMGKA